MFDRLQRRMGGKLRIALRLQFAILVTALLSSCLFSGGGDVDDDDDNNVNAGNRNEDCEAYCELMSQSCPATFADDGACIQQCERYPRVPETGEGDTVVPLGEPVNNRNSLECRVYHATLAGETGRLDNIHCGHAGPDGANTCVEKPLCEEFCFGAEDFPGFIEVCAGTEVALAASECLQLCSGLPDGTRGDETGDTVHCRLTWALQAQQLNNLCANAGRNSPTCSNLVP